MSAAQRVSDVLKALEDIPSFDYIGYREGIKGILGVNKDQWNSACTAQVYGEDPDGSKALIQRFKVQTIALGVSRVQQYNFSSQVVTDGFEDKLAQTAAGLVVPIFRNHLEEHLKAKGIASSINDLAKDQDFCFAFLEHVLDPAFINNSLIIRFFRQADYTQSIAYLYERFRPCLRQMPNDKKFSNSLSSQPQPVKTISAFRFGEIDILINAANTHTTLKATNQVQNFLNTNLPIEWSDNALLQKPRFKDLGKAWAKNWMGDTYTTSIVNDLISKDAKFDYPPNSGQGEPQTVFVTYGDKLWQWMVSQQTSGYGDIFRITDRENFNYVPPTGGSCFAPNARLALPGYSISIADLQPGTQVLTKAPGEIGTSSFERVEHPTSSSTFGNTVEKILLFGINGEEPFVTAGHIFNTLSGPKAIRPDLALLENDDIVISELKRGDVLLRLKTDQSGYDHVTVESLNSSPALHSSVHGVHFAKGAKSNTYHVNGYWVRENYPDVTLDSMTKRYQTMSLSEQISFSKYIRQLPSTFKNILGPVVYHAVQTKFSSLQSANTPVPFKSTLLDKVERSSRNLPGIKTFSGVYTLASHQICQKPGRVINSTSHHFRRTLKHIHGNDELSDVMIDNGLVATKHGLASHTSASHMTINWSRKISADKDLYEHCVLRSVYYNFAAAGYTAIGPAEPRSMHDFISIKPVMAIANANTYMVSGSNAAFDDPSKALVANYTEKKEWSTWWKMTIGINIDDKGVASVAVALPDLDRYYHAGCPEYVKEGLTLYKTNPIIYLDGQMTIAVDIIDGMGSLAFTPLLANWGNVKVDDGTSIDSCPGFASFVIVLNLYTNAVHGYYTELKGDDAGPIHALAVSTPSTILAAQKHLIQLKSHLSEETAVSDYPQSFPLPATRLLATSFFTSDNLSISDLQTMVVPTNTQLNSTSQTYLQNASTYWRGQDEIKVFGSEQASTKTALPVSGSLTDSLDQKARDWLAEFQRSLLLQGLQKDSRYTKHFTEEKTEQLEYYFQGGQKGCLSVHSQYNKVSAVCTTESFLGQTPALQAYYDDSRDWAKDFYNFTSRDEQLNNQAFAMVLDPNSNMTNRYCMILNALDKKGQNYRDKLWTAVRDKILVSGSNGKLKADELPEFMQQFTEQLITQIQSGPGGEPFDTLKATVNNIYTEFATTDAKDIASRLFSTASDIGQCFLEAFSDFKDYKLLKNKASYAEDMARWEAEIRAKYSPKLAGGYIKLVRCSYALVGLGMDAFGIYLSVKFFQSWDNLKPWQRAQAIIGLVQTAINTARDLYTVFKVITNGDPTSIPFKINCIKWNKETGSTNEGGRRVMDEDDNNETGGPLLEHDNIQSIANPEGESITVRLAETVTEGEIAEQLTKEFSLVDATSKTISIAANITACVCIGMEIKADFDKDTPPGIKAMDILSEIQMGIQVITEVVELSAMVLGIECLAIPIVGLVIALIGIVLMLCEEFVPRPAPADPVEQYINDKLDAFLNTIPKRPDLTLAYDITQDLKTNQVGILQIKITNPSKSKLKFRTMTVSIPAGDDDTQLFVAPSGVDETQTPYKSPSENLVFYALNDQSSFEVSGSAVANATDGNLVARIQPIGFGVKSAVFPDDGLLLLIKGNVNSKAGVVKLTVRETADDRPAQDIPNSDYYTFFKVKKSN